MPSVDTHLHRIPFGQSADAIEFIFQMARWVQYRNKGACPILGSHAATHSKKSHLLPAAPSPLSHGHLVIELHGPA